MSVYRSPRAKMVYVEELDALVQEDLIPDLMAFLCSDRECDPPFGGKKIVSFIEKEFVSQRL